MSRIGVILLMLVIWVQSVTLLSQRAFVADPVELAHVKVIDDAEVEKPNGRLNFDSAADLSYLCLATMDFAGYAFRCQITFCLAHQTHANFQRGPPALI